VKKIDDVFNLKVILEMTKKSESEMKTRPEDYIGESEDFAESIVCELVDSHHGRYMPEIILDIFGVVGDDDEEFIHDVIDGICDGISEEMNNWLEKIYPEHLGILELGYDWNGDFSLMYMVDLDKLDKCNACENGDKLACGDCAMEGLHSNFIGRED
jgi:hypothetical protein